MARMSEEKKGFYLYNDYLEHVSLMSDEDAGKLLKAILIYENGMDVGEMSGMSAMAFSFIKSQLDRDAEKYDTICARNRANGAKGGRPRKTQQTEAEREFDGEKPNTDQTAGKETQPNPNKPGGFSNDSKETGNNPVEPNETLTDTDTETDKDTDIKNNKNICPKPRYTKDFEEWWKAYPRHDDKGSAYAKYQARLKDGFSHQELLTACLAYADECSRRHTEKYYIKQGKTFLSDKTPFTDYLPKENETGTIDTGYGEVDFASYIRKGGKT